MIISASRRTDIPAFYSEWFFNRIRDGFVLVRNPMNIHQISKISLKRDVVDFIVFWTKNPEPMLNKLDEIKEYKYYFQFTLNSYDKEIEVNVPKKDLVIDTFKRLSDKIGSNRVIWRYDPIIINDKFNMEYHYKYFEALAKRLNGFTEKCIISFVDFYRNADRNLKSLNVQRINNDTKVEIALRLSEIATLYGLKIETCAEDIELSSQGIQHAKCIDRKLIEEIIGDKLDISKDPNQRPACGCVASIDIGTYNTCDNNCLYCYANFNKSIVAKNRKLHNTHSPLIFGEVSPEDKIIIKKAESCILAQRTIF